MVFTGIATKAATTFFPAASAALPGAEAALAVFSAHAVGFDPNLIRTMALAGVHGSVASKTYLNVLFPALTYEIFPATGAGVRSQGRNIGCGENREVDVWPILLSDSVYGVDPSGAQRYGLI